MTATPDGISMGDLLKLQEQAAASSTVNEPTGPHGGLTDQQVLDLADRLVDELGDTCPAPVAVKALLLETINRMIGWHTQVGYDIELMSNISSKVNIPIIASGGVGNLDHLVDGIKLGKASAVLAASIFHYGKHSVKEAKEYLDSKGIPVRI